MDILLIALLVLPLLWLIVSPTTAWKAVFAWQYRDPDRVRPTAAPAVRAVGVVGLITVLVILAVLIAQRVSDGNRVSACDAEVAPEIDQILQDRPDDLAAALDAVAARHGWTTTTIADTSTTFRDGDETVMIVQHDPASSSPVICW